MKKYTNTLLALLVAGTFAGCGSSNDTDVTEEVNTSTSEAPKEETTPSVQTQEQNQKMPTCYIKKGTPLTESLITVHAKCKNGNIPIDEAKVTLDNTLKDVAYKGTYFSDYIGFRNLQPSTTYKAVLEVVVGGTTIKKSVKIKTKEEKIKVTPTPTPIVHAAPKWKKKVYDDIYKEIQNPNESKLILDLSKETLANDEDKITYKIIDSKYKILEYGSCIQDAPFSVENIIRINSNKLVVNEMPPCISLVTVVVQAKSLGGVSNATIKVNFQDSLFIPIGNIPLFDTTPKPFDDNNITYAKYNDEIDTVLAVGNMIVVNLPNTIITVVIKKVSIETKENYYFSANSNNENLVYMTISKGNHSLIGTINTKNFSYGLLYIDKEHIRIDRRSYDSFGED